MVVLRPLLAQLLRMSVRRFFAAGSRGRDAGVVVVAVGAFVCAPRAARLATEAATRLHMGEGDRAVLVLNGLFLAWALVPLLLRGGGMDMDGIVRLQRLPCTRLQMLAVGLAETLATPLLWLLLAALIGLIPMALAAPIGPWAGLGMVLFAACCPAAMLTVSHLMSAASVSFRGRLVAGGLATALLAVAAVRPELLTRCLPGAAWVRTACSTDPAAWWTLAAGTGCLIGAAVLSFAGLLADLHRGSGNGRPALRALPVPVPPLPGTWGRFLRRGIQGRLGCVEPWVALAVAAAATAAFVSGPEPAPQAVYFALACAGLATHGLWANLFGGDGAGVLRTLLWPVSGRRLVVLHQACCLTVSLAGLSPVFWLVARRLGVTAAAAALVFVMTQMVLLALVGMHVSLDDPVPRGPLRNLRGLRAGLIPGLIVCALSLALLLGAGRAQSETAGLLYHTVALSLCLTAYLARLGPIGSRLEEAAPHLQARLDLS